MAAGPRFDWYDWAGGREAMLRFGPEAGPVVVVAMPLFEEANRTRALIVAALRGLAERGVASALPDLPGQGESLVLTVDARMHDWRAAFAAAVSPCGERTYGFAVRGGALVDGDAAVRRRLHLSPVAGKVLVRDLLRARRAAAITAGERPPLDDPAGDGPPLLLAGNLVERALLRDLMKADPSRADRTIRLFPDADPADRTLAPADPPAADGTLPRFRSPWTASEPFTDERLAAVLTDEIAAWVRSCES